MELKLGGFEESEGSYPSEHRVDRLQIERTVREMLVAMR